MNIKTKLREITLLVSVAVVVRALFILLAPADALSIDIQSWRHVAEQLQQGNNPYRTTTMLNWPPVWMQLIFAFSKVAALLGLTFVGVLQCFLIAAEALLVVVVYLAAIKLFPQEKIKQVLLFGICLNPVGVYQVCQHGNFDVLVGITVLLAVFFAILFRQSNDPMDWLLACASLGLAILLKTAPFILLPICILGHQRLSVKTKVLGALLLFFPISLGLGTIYVLAPADVEQKVFAYRSASGWFGISGILQQIPRLDQVLVPLYSKVASMLLIGFLGCMTLWSYLLKDYPRLYPLWLALLLLLAVIVFGPGYGPQYVEWFLPLLLLLYLGEREPAMRGLLVKVLVVGALTYTLEYGLFSSHGSFLLRNEPSAFMESWGRNWSTQRGQTLVRLPLFYCYFRLFKLMAKEVFRDLGPLRFIWKQA